MRLAPYSLRRASRDFYKHSQGLNSRLLSTFQNGLVNLLRSSVLSIRWYPPMIVYISILILGAMMQTLFWTLFGFSFLRVAASGLCLILFLLPFQVLAEIERKKLSATSQED